MNTEHPINFVPYAQEEIETEFGIIKFVAARSDDLRLMEALQSAIHIHGVENLTEMIKCL